MAASDHLVVTVEAEVHPPGSEIPVKKRAGTVEQEVVKTATLPIRIQFDWDR